MNLSQPNEIYLFVHFELFEEFFHFPPQQPSKPQKTSVQELHTTDSGLHSPLWCLISGFSLRRVWINSAMCELPWSGISVCIQLGSLK